MAWPSHAVDAVLTTVSNATIAVVAAAVTADGGNVQHRMLLVPPLGLLMPLGLAAAEMMALGMGVLVVLMVPMLMAGTQASPHSLACFQWQRQWQHL